MKHGRTENKGVDQMKEELSAINLKRHILGIKLIETWDQTGKHGPGAGLIDLANKDINRAKRTAMAIEMQESHLKRISEDTISTTFSLRPENVLKVVRIGTANSNRGDFATEYPLMTTDDAIYFINMTYDKTLRGPTQGDLLYENVYPYYAGEEISAKIDDGGAGTNYAGTLSPASCVPFKFRLVIANQIVAVDDGAGNIVGSVLDTAEINSIDYDTGDFVLNFLVAPGVGVDINAIWNWNSEDSAYYDQFGTVGIGLDKRRFQVRPHPLGYSFTTMTKLVLGTTGLGDAEELLVGAVGDEHAKAKDYKAINKLKMVAMGNPLAEFDCNFAGIGEISANEHAQNILGKIKSVGATIYDDIKRGQVNKIIAGSQALVYLQKHRLWNDDLSQGRVGCYKAGRLSDMDVFCTPQDTALINSDQMLLTFKNPEEGIDVSVVFGVLTEIAAALEYPEFKKVGNVASVEDTITVNSKFTRLLELKNLSL